MALSAAHAGDDAINLKCKVILFRNLLHGTSEQRKYWFMKGYKTGDLNQGNSFDAQR
jgi:predicted metalloprotease